MSSRPSIITLTTDFGYRDHYVSAMKAVILNINPTVRLIDVSHDIPPQDIMAGAWVTRNSAFLYPADTIHLVVIDPGVGTSRKMLVVRIKDQLFVGPDNGLFSLVADGTELEAYELSNTSFWGSNRSNTFHGRDVFAPVAAHISNGIRLSEFGQRVPEIYTYRWPKPVADNEGIQGWIVHIDRYGNLITNISRDLLFNHPRKNLARIYVGNTIIKHLVQTFSDVAEGEAAAFLGSAGMLEIAINSGNAEEMLGVIKGAPVSVLFHSN